MGRVPQCRGEHRVYFCLLLKFIFFLFPVSHRLPPLEDSRAAEKKKGRARKPCPSVILPPRRSGRPSALPYPPGGQSRLYLHRPLIHNAEGSREDSTLKRSHFCLDEEVHLNDQLVNLCVYSMIWFVPFTSPNAIMWTPSTYLWICSTIPHAISIPVVPLSILEITSSGTSIPST